MLFKIPASESEQSSVCEAAEKTVESFCVAADCIQDFVGLLESDFLGVDKEYKKQLDREFTRLSAAMWRLRIAQYKTLENQERVVQVSKVNGDESI